MSLASVQDVMTRDVVTVLEDAPFKDVVRTLLDNHVSAVPVVNAVGELVGIVTEEDLVPKEADLQHKPRLLRLLADSVSPRAHDWMRKAHGLTAHDVMSGAVATALPGERLHLAAERMLDLGVKRLPVVEGKRLVGIIARHDLLRPFVRTDDELERDVKRFLDECAFGAPDHDVHVVATGGTVRLTGSVQFDRDVRVAGTLAGSVDGVVAVDNRLAGRSRDPRPYVAAQAFGSS